MIAKAEKFYAANKEVEREKISQADALKQINSKTCDLSNKDAGYLICFNASAWLIFLRSTSLLAA